MVCGRAQGQQVTGPHDAVGPQDSQAAVGDMHGAAFAFAEPVGLAVKFGHHPVEVRAFGDDVTVAPVGGVDVIGVPQVQADTRRHRLLADGQVNGFGWDVSVPESLGQMLFKGPDRHHGPV